MFRIAVLLVSVCSLIGLAVFFYMPGKAEGVATSFFISIKSNEWAQAYDDLSDEFKAEVNASALKEYFKAEYNYPIDQVEWHNKTGFGGMMELLGLVKTANSSYLPVKLTLIKQGDLWKIYSFQKPPAGFIDRADFAAIPGERDLVVLASQAMYDFALAVKQKSMAHFYRSIAHLWQKQITLDELNNAYRPFLLKSPDLTVLAKLAPVFAEPASLNKQNVLLLKGFYPIASGQVKFELKYIYEGFGWKLIGFKIDI